MNIHIIIFNFLCIKMTKIYKGALNELSSVFEKIDDEQVDKAIDIIAKSNKIVVFAGGREKLQIMGFAMRLFHMGLNISVEGDMTTPPVRKGDLFISSVGTGYISTALALMEVAKNAGASTLMVTAQPSGKCSKFADFILNLPAQTMADDQGEKKTSILPMGSLFEGSLFILFEVMVLKLIDKLNIDSDFMRSNHTNLE